MRLADLANLVRFIGREAGSLLVGTTLPETCAGCGVAGAWLCPDCRALVAEDHRPGCQRCGRRGTRKRDCSRCAPIFPSALSVLRAGFAFDGPMRSAVHQFKYAREHERGRHLGRMLAARFESLFPKAGIDAIVPVPLHPRRLRERGFNQSEILAEELVPVCGAPLISAVRRSRHTTPQASLRSEQRLRNLAGAFVPVDDHRHSIDGRNVLIVDDVTTTGATIAAVADALQDIRAKKILAITLAREQ